MKRVVLFLVSVFYTVIIIAQSPQKMSYQAVIRNSSNMLVTNVAVGMKISILKGSASGTIVYTEIQTPTTNGNGLVNIEIGGGSGFDTINWVSDIFFIKTETDPNGGTIYSVSGTSQLLTVPYAFYAKTAGSTNGTSGHYVGELYGGGVVFWVDQSGQHGLIVSMVDLSTNQVWSNMTIALIGATAQSDWNGLGNSNAIVGQNGHTSSAAKLCLDYTNVNYGTGVDTNWYLPSRIELLTLWNNFYAVQKAIESDGNPATLPLSKSSYWSSSEYMNMYAYYLKFPEGDLPSNQKSNSAFVRAVRAF